MGKYDNGLLEGITTIHSQPKRYATELATEKHFFSFLAALRKKVEPKWLHPGAVLENGATLEGGAVFSLIIIYT